MLAIYVHYGRCVNQALHILESDGPVMFVLVHTMDWVVSQLDRVPSADPYFDTITAGLDATLIVNCRSMADAMVKTARAYINARWVELPEDVSKFDGFRLAKMLGYTAQALNPAYAIHASLDSLSLHIHKSFASGLKCLVEPQHGGFTQEEAQTLITKELPAFKAAIKDMDFADWWDDKHAAKLDMEKLRAWWVAHKTRFPMMYRLVIIMFTLVHHSCYAERMFSNLNRVMDEQKSSLEDYREGCVMLSMNQKPLAEAELMLALSGVPCTDI
jgi:hypothetical protein